MRSHHRSNFRSRLTASALKLHGCGQRECQPLRQVFLGRLRLTLTASLALFIRLATLGPGQDLFVILDHHWQPGDAFATFFLFFYLTHLSDNAGRCNACSLKGRLRGHRRVSFLFIVGAICGFSSHTAHCDYPSTFSPQYPWHPPHLLGPVLSVLVSQLATVIPTHFEHPSSTLLCNSASAQVGPWKT
jgi:hypothetical protein